MLHLVFLALILANHPVNEPALERSEIWGVCCRRADCKPQRFEVLLTTGIYRLTQVGYEKDWIARDKFHPVPSRYTWVCYEDITGKFVDDNVRCLLYPQAIPMVLT